MRVYFSGFYCFLREVYGGVMYLLSERWRPGQVVASVSGLNCVVGGLKHNYEIRRQKKNEQSSEPMYF